MIVAFGGLEKRLGGGARGFAPFEFVKTCEAVGARWTLFVRDAAQAWYLCGLEDVEGSDSFDSVVEVIRAEIAVVQPRRVVTIGASMGGYAAVRAAIALSADAAIAFSPQVLLDPDERAAMALPLMTFDPKLCALKERAREEGFEMEALTSVVRRAPATAATAIELHVGAAEEGDMAEARMLKEAVLAKEPPSRLSCSLHVHSGCDHSVVGALRDSGELLMLLRRQLGQAPLGWAPTPAAAPLPGVPAGVPVPGGPLVLGSAPGQYSWACF